MPDLKETIKSYYNGVSQNYEIKHGVDLYGGIWSIKKYYLPLISRFIPENMEILELGCGTGKYTSIFKKIAKRIHGVDIAPKMIEIAKQRNPDVEFTVGDCETLENFREEEFDVVAAVNVFSYFPNKKKALQSIYRILRTDGIFFDLDMNGYSPVYFISSLLKSNQMDVSHQQVKESRLNILGPLLEKAGFEVIYKKELNWIPHTLNKPLVRLLQPFNVMLSALPYINKFANRIIIIGKKSGRSAPNETSNE